MTKRGCALALPSALALLFMLGVWLNFATAIERERALSSDGEWIAIAYINGMPLTAENEKVHIWRWWQPRFRWLGCQVLEAKNESPTRLSWQGKRLAVEHGFRPGELLDIRNQCGPVRVLFEKKFKPYS
jgi:hypothetical protein